MSDLDSAPLLERLGDTMPELRKSERKVGRLVIADPAFVASSSMLAVARAAEVSEPTVMRFSTAMGFDGFQAFKIALAQTLAIGLPATLSSIALDDPVHVLATKIFDHTLASLDRARRGLDIGKVERAVQALLQARHIVFVGLGASGIIALDAEQKAPLFGVPCSAPIDSHQQFMAASTAGPGSVFVTISNTGRTTSIIRIADLARRNGATVIAISGEESPLTAQSDIAVIVRTIEDTDVHTPTVSRLAGLVVIDLLATAVALGRDRSHLERLNRMKGDLAAFRSTP